MTQKNVILSTLVVGCGVLLGNLTPMLFSQSEKTLEQRVKELEQGLKEVKLQATRAQDVLDIMDLQARYEAIHSTQEYLGWMLYANRPDSSDEVTHTRLIGFEAIKLQFTDQKKLMELYRAGKLPAGTHIRESGGAPGGGSAPGGSGTPPADAGGAPATGSLAGAGGGAPSGSFGPPTAGGNAAKAYTGKVYGKGTTGIPPIHPISTPNIIVADDGKTAKATFTSLGWERGGWCYGKYANDYIKIDGKWYIWHKKWLRGWSADYDVSPENKSIEQIFEWTTEKDANGFPVVAKELTTQYLWYPGKESLTITAPKPYKTWTKEDDNGAWWKRPTVTP